MLLYIFQFKFSKNLFTADTGQVIVLDPPAQVAVKDDVVKNTVRRTLSPRCGVAVKPIRLFAPEK